MYFATYYTYSTLLRVPYLIARAVPNCTCRILLHVPYLTAPYCAYRTLLHLTLRTVPYCTCRTLPQVPYLTARALPYCTYRTLLFLNARTVHYCTCRTLPHVPYLTLVLLPVYRYKCPCNSFFSCKKNTVFPALFFTKVTNGHQLHVQISYAWFCQRRTINVDSNAKLYWSS